jgi:arylsulfatase A-like enzyme
MTAKPNILFIILDTLRRDRLGIYGYQRPTSPRLDAFAARSTRFTRAVAPAQWTIPSHASMFSGLYPSHHQVTQSSSVLSGAHPTLAEILQANDYHTVAFCNNPLVGAIDHGLQRGFTEFYNYATAVPQRPNEAERGILYREFKRRFRPFARKVGNQFAQHDWMFRLALNPIWVPIWTKYINFKGNTVTSIADSIAYWQSHQAGGAAQPLFMFLNLMQSHLPFHPPQQHVDRVAPDLRNDRRAYQYMGRFNADGKAWASPPDPPLEDWQQRVLSDFYDAEIAFQDEQLGTLLAYLERSGALDNTFVVITADHGEGLGDHDLFGHGFDVHQELVHVPLVMRGADRVAEGGVIAENVSTRRIFHTLLDVAGVKPPLAYDDPNAQVDSLSLLTAVRGEDGEAGTAFSEAIAPTTFLHVLEHHKPALVERLRLRQTRRAVYRGDHKLMLLHESPRALYDVAADPTEQENVLESQPGIASDLTRRLLTFVREGERGSTQTHQQEVDDEVMEQLRALGYVD